MGVIVDSAFSTGGNVVVSAAESTGDYIITASNPNTTDDASLWTGLVDTATGDPITIVDGDKAKILTSLPGLVIDPDGTITADETGDFVVQIWLASEGVWGGDQTVTFTVPSADTTPDQFTLTDQTGVALGTVIESNAITVSGVDADTDVPVSITGGEYAVDAGAGFGAFTSAATNAQLGYQIKVRHTSSATNSAPTNTTLDVGGVTDTFTTTTLAAAGVAPLVSRQRVKMSIETTTIRMSL